MKERTPEEVKEIREDVKTRYNLVFPNVVLEPLWYGRRPSSANRIPDRFAIVDQNTGSAFNVCTSAYQPVLHEEVIHLVEEAANKLPEFGKPTISVQLLSDGGKLRVEAKFAEVLFDINPKVHDLVNPTIDVFSSYDLGWKYSGAFGAFRLVCSNGLKVGQTFDSFKKRHLVSLDPNELSATITNGMNKFSEQTGLWREWAEEKMLPNQYEELWAELPFSQPEREKIEALPEASTSLILPTALKSGELNRWMFYSVATQYATHEIKSELRRIEIQPAITKAFEHKNRRAT
jgi:hypothetical protein